MRSLKNGNSKKRWTFGSILFVFVCLVISGVFVKMTVDNIEQIRHLEAEKEERKKQRAALQEQYEQMLDADERHMDTLARLAHRLPALEELMLRQQKLLQAQKERLEHQDKHLRRSKKKLAFWNTQRAEIIALIKRVERINNSLEHTEKVPDKDLAWCRDQRDRLSQISKQRNLRPAEHYTLEFCMPLLIQLGE